MVSGNRDLLPYRDFFFQAPPGYPMLTRSITAIFGARVIGLVFVGALIRTLSTLALYGLLLRVARPWCAAFAAVVSLIVSSGDIADVPHYYNHVALGLVVCGTYLGVASVEQKGRRAVAMAIAGGAIIAFGIAQKQTATFAAAGAAATLFTLRRPEKPLRFLGLLSIGGLVSLTAIVGWLASNRLVDAFLRMMRVAPQGKGGIGASLVRPVMLLDKLPGHRAITLIAIGILVLCAALPRLRGRYRGVLAIIGIAAIAYTGAWTADWGGRALALLLTALGFWGCLFVAVLGAVAGRREWLGLALFGFAAAYTCAVSWPLFDNMAFPSIGIVTCFALEAASRQQRHDLRGAVTAVAVAGVVLVAHRKYSEPYGWGPWIEQPLSEAAASKHPELAFMLTSPATEKLYDSVVEVTNATTTPSDPIYVYPNMPVLYGIAHRRPATFALAHWVDICPDYLGRKDADRLLANPPKLIIIRRDPDDQILSDERMYRDGRPSSVREILRALHRLKPRYRTVGMFRMDSVTPPIEFLQRID